MPIGIGTAILLSGGISALAGGAASLYGSGQQASSEKNAIGAQEHMFGVAANELQPYITGGANSLGWYNYLTGTGANPNGGGTQYNPLTAPLTAPFTAANLPTTPGYQFTLNQGLKDTQNSYAAQGLGSSGAASKGSASYATGLAQSTYNQQLQNYLMQNQQIANLLYQPAQLGANAAGSLAGAAVQTGSSIGSNMVGEGNALAGGAVGTANAVSGAGNSALQYSLLNQLIQSRTNPAATVNNAIPTGGTPWPGATSPYQPSPWG
jgi:hypothetical protein